MRKASVFVGVDPRYTYFTGNNKMFHIFCLLESMLLYSYFSSVTLSSLPLSVSYIRVWGSEISMPRRGFVPSSLQKNIVSF